ncbi:MAG: hypothetical protein ABIZ04_05005 [Opitutus sp.]
MRKTLGLLVGCSTLLVHGATGEVVVDFEQAKVGARQTEWVEQGVTFKLAHSPVQTKAAGKVTFFPHLETGHKGILNAMAMEPIAVEARFPGVVSAVTLVLWGSTGCAAKLEAFDAQGQSLEVVGLDKVPQRAAPGDPVPMFELKVSKPGIASVRFSGPRGGEFLAADEVRFTPDSRSDLKSLAGTGTP